VEFRILGPFEVEDEGVAISLGGGNERALLTILLLHGNQLLSADRLVDDLWGASAPATAGKMLQIYVSRLRKALGHEAIVTRSPGYVLPLAAGQLDLDRFEQRAAEGRQALSSGSVAAAAAALREALGLFRGPPLADFVYERFAQPSIARIEELRLACFEDWVETQLALGSAGELVAEIESLLEVHPFRERLRSQLLLALYRAGRQADALAAYQDARRRFVEELGIEPSRALQQLERAILLHDPALEHIPAEPISTASEPSSGKPSILVTARGEDPFDSLLALAEPLARSRSPHELIVVRLIVPGRAEGLPQAVAAADEQREQLLGRAVACRAAAFTSREPDSDTAKLASEQGVDLLLLGCPQRLLEGQPPPPGFSRMLEQLPCDMALLVDRHPFVAGSILVPFSGDEHDWTALELGAWLAHACGTPLWLAGTAGSEDAGKRDASRLLASASLAVQHVAGITAEPLLVEPGPDALLAAAKNAALLVVGLSQRFATEGLGASRLALARRAVAPIVFARRGLRPGGLAPLGTATRFTWSLAAPAAEAETSA
jgi:DNA-binding SARP family transcriptional activator